MFDKNVSFCHFHLTSPGKLGIKEKKRKEKAIQIGKEEPLFPEDITLFTERIPQKAVRANWQV